MDIFEKLKSESDISTKEGKAQLASKANALIQKMHNSLFKDLLIEELSTLVGLSHQHLESKLSSDVKNKKPAPKKVKHARTQQVSNNKTRLAVALLIQNPALATQHKVPESFKQAFNKGLPLLHTLQQTIESNTIISSAALLERFRNTEHEKTLNTLSMLQTPETENKDIIIETYKEIIERLNTEERSEYFKNKLENNEQLTQEEWNEYLKRPEIKH